MSAGAVFAATQAGSKPGMEIWRIEKLNPVPVDPKTYGSFFSGDCYLVLHTYKKSEVSNKLDADLYFWQGEHSSQDERGASAYRAVELDDYLGGVPTQHREVQGHESAKFLSLFPAGIQLLDGGIESGFNHVDRDAYQPRLFHLKGKRNVRCVQVELSAKQLNDGDVYILDAGLTLYQWNGAQANRQEKFKGLELLTKIKDSERGGKARAVFLESGQKSADVDEFFRVLGGSPADVRSADAEGSDEHVQAAPASLWRISDASGSLEITQIASGRLTRDMLDQNDVFLLDGGGELFVWVGRGATKQERAKGMDHAVEYLKTHGRPEWIPITRLPGGGETPAFKSFFVAFDKEVPIAAEPEYVAKERKELMGVLLEKQHKAEEKLLDMSKGSSVQVWRIENLKRVPVSEDQFGQFYSGDSYIVLLKYRAGNRDSYILYFWQGRDSSTDEKTASALLSVELAQEMGDLPGTQVRVVQGKEPHQFLALFKGKMVVRYGGVEGSGGFAKGGAAAAASGAEGVHLFHIRGSNSIDTRAVEVAPRAQSLNSGDAFVLLTPASAFLWLGAGSNSDEREVAQRIAKDVLGAGSVESVNEGSEPAAFWEALGGQAAYASDKHLQTQPAEPRLFQVSGVTGDFTVEELFNFAQDDLSQDGVFLLDTVAEVQVWVGAHARPADRDAALNMAMRYVSNAPDGRSPNTPVFKITAGAEPPTFTANFLGWSYEKGQDFADPYLARLAVIQAKDSAAPAAASASATPAKPVAAAAAAFSKPAQVTPAPAPAAAATAAPTLSGPSSGSATAPGPFYSLAELKAGIPAGVVASKKELHLSDADFEAVLGVNRDAFAKLAGWKQADIKKKAGIF